MEEVAEKRGVHDGEAVVVGGDAFGGAETMHHISRVEPLGRTQRSGSAPATVQGAVRSEPKPRELTVNKLTF